MYQEPTFIPKTIKIWKGRYGRLFGGCDWKLVLGAGNRYSPQVYWLKDRNTKCDCLTASCQAINSLSRAVYIGKRYLNGSGGGVFVINEYGQVIVPSSLGKGQRVLVGEIHGTILLKNPLSNSDSDEWMDISNDSGLRYGNPWPGPYLGVQYHLSNINRIYYVAESAESTKPQFLQPPDNDLIAKIRKVRRMGPVRVLVNVHGIVLTKTPANDSWSPENNDYWNPVYVGRIDKTNWFPKEE
ncbi:MAG: hypothetical protein IMZ61_06975 [Planctomycetes bacterium]|nr:hypothetical protein [Planctomycetota bacterium]